MELYRQLKVSNRETGERFGKWTIIGATFMCRLANDKNRGKVAVCECECGRVSVIRYAQLRYGGTSECQSCVGNKAKLANRSHGMSYKTEFFIWANMVQRCHNENNPNFLYYGARGVTVCDRWRHSFQAFYEDMGPRPSKQYTLDRINNDGNYEPGNCKWSTQKEQQNNRRPMYTVKPKRPYPKGVTRKRQRTNAT